MPRYFIKLAYNGAAYHGWQIQPNAHTVQAELNKKLGLLLHRDINVAGCGRTDTGVHAREFYAHFDVDEALDFSGNTKDFVYRLNSFLPNDIAVYGLWRVTDDLHARFSAVSRTYRYCITRKKNPFLNGLAYYYHGALDVDKMKKAAEILYRYTDFTSFSKVHTQTKTNECTIEKVLWEEKEGLLVFTITADRFLRNMVRAVTGTLLEIGRGRLGVEDMKRIIEAKDRSKAGFSVPAHGLFLEKIVYPGWNDENEIKEY